MNDLVDIILATYNGEKYLPEQLESLLHQTHQNIKILVGDDVSSDSTSVIVRDYCNRYPDKIVFFQYPDNVGTILNFSRIAELVDAPYAMFSDQDDVWLPEKIEKSLKKMKEMEKEWGEETPILIHTNSRLVDDDNRLIHPSWWDYSDIHPTYNSLQRILCQNNALGCTMMLNKPLVDLAFPVPIEAYMHDYWITLTATALGKVGWIPEATINYRQHGNNFIGAYKNPGIKDFFSLITDKKICVSSTRLYYAKIIQAYMFYKRFEQVLDEDKKEILKQFISLKNGTFFDELKLRCKYDFHRGGSRHKVFDLLASYMHGPIPEQYKIKVY